ncbi:MAG: signal recognition particle protein [Verrucomicrobiae bacterium]|nr:signal recognition particle protein [Verrucomicrobiae bacterium]
MLENLSEKLQKVFRNLRGYGKLTESNIGDALNEVRKALLEADVNYKVAKEFVAGARTKCLGQEVLKSVTPGQQVVKIIHEELVTLMGSSAEPLKLDKSPSKIIMVGLNGSGKTTTSGKLARYLQKQGRSPLLVACDVYRPAAIEQLKTLGEQLGIPVFTVEGEQDITRIAAKAIGFAVANHHHIVIIDTAGRQQIDEPLMQELVRLKAEVNPQEILLVADSATGQQAVDIAKHFNEKLELTGIILTKLDGDARGGAALSMKAVTGKPIKFAGVGEKLEDFEPFYPERLASRILGMGDIVSLVEKAQESVDMEKAEKLAEKLKTRQFDLGDFLEQVQQIKKMGSIENLLGMLPGMNKVKDLSVDETRFNRIEAIIQSMTPKERARPEVINGSRRLRISKGSGTQVSDVNDLLRQFQTMKKMMKNMGQMEKLMARHGASALFGK